MRVQRLMNQGVREHGMSKIDHHVPVFFVILTVLNLFKYSFKRRMCLAVTLALEYVETNVGGTRSSQVD